MASLRVISGTSPTRFRVYVYMYYFSVEQISHQPSILPFLFFSLPSPSLCLSLSLSLTQTASSCCFCHSRRFSFSTCRVFTISRRCARTKLILVILLIQSKGIFPPARPPALPFSYLHFVSTERVPSTSIQRSNVVLFPYSLPPSPPSSPMDTCTYMLFLSYIATPFFYLFFLQYIQTK